MAVLMPLARLCNVQLIDSPQLRCWKSCTHCDRKQVRGGCPSGDLWWWSSKENMHNELYLLYEKSVLAYLLALLTLSSKDEFGNLPVAALMQRNCFKTQSTLFSSIPVIENRESALTYRQSQTGFQIFVCLFQFLLCIGIVIRSPEITFALQFFLLLLHTYWSWNRVQPDAEFRPQRFLFLPSCVMLKLWLICVIIYLF